MGNSPSPQDNGWTVENKDIAICWMKKDPVPDELLSFIHCKCAEPKCDTKRCSCRSNGVPCTDLCECHDCTHMDKSVSMPFESVGQDSDSGDDM